MPAAAMSRLARPVVVLGVVAGLLLAVTTAAVAQGADLRLDGKVRAGGGVIVESGETVDGDLYVAAGNIVVDGTVTGDLVASGGRIDVSGTVEGDALLAGGDVRVSGDVDGDLRVAAGQATFTGTVGEDLLVGAGQATVASTATVGEDLVFGTGRMRMRGTVEGGAVGNAGDYTETGRIAGTRDITEAPEEEPPTFGDRVLDVLQRYVTILVVGALLLWLAGRWARSSISRLRQEPWLSLGVGALTLAGAAVGVIGLIVAGVLVTILLALIGLGGLAATIMAAVLLAVAVLVFTLVVAAVWLAPVVLGTWLGRLVVRDGESWGRLVAALAIGAAVIVVTGAIPFIGPLVWTIVVVLGVGALVLMAFRRRGIERGDSRVPPAPAGAPRTA